MYYALSDSATGNLPVEHTSGFANTTVAVAFVTRQARDAWVLETNLLKARALTRAEAVRYAYRASGYEVTHDGKAVEMDSFVVDMADQPDEYARVAVLRHA